MAKPFSIQSPEDIAKEYAGNKQKIAQAMQMGIVDPTAGVLAGMFIDRMRAAQMQEQAPQTTVAQQVMGGAPPVPAPPLPAGGLGATAQAAPPMAPQMGMAPPMPQEAPMGMADGGLAMLPVPDTMFDEPTNGGFNDGYAGGGIVAFSDGGATDIQREFDAAFPHSAPINPAAPMYYGYSLDPRQNMAIARELMGTPESKYSGMLEQDLLETFDPAASKKRRQARENDLLMDLGFRMAASRSPTLLGAFGEAGMGALPAAREAQRLDKAEEKYARKALADLEAGRNTQRAQLATQALQMQQAAIQGYEAETGRKFQASEKQLDRDLEWRIASMKEAGDNARAAMRSRDGDGGEGSERGETVTLNRYTELQEKLLAAEDEMYAAKAKWEAAGKPTVRTAKTARERAIAREFGNAGRAYTNRRRMLESVQPRGGTPRAPSKGGTGKRPADIPANVWNAMTPEERALF